MKGDRCKAMRSHLVLLVEHDLALPLHAPAPNDSDMSIDPPLKPANIASNAVDLVPHGGGRGEGEDVIQRSLCGGDVGGVVYAGEDGDRVEVGDKLGGEGGREDAVGFEGSAEGRFP